MANVMDETEGVTDVDMTEKRDIPDPPPMAIYEGDVQNCLCQNGFLANALCVYI